MPVIHAGGGGGGGGADSFDELSDVRITSPLFPKMVPSYVAAQGTKLVLDVPMGTDYSVLTTATEAQRTAVLTVDDIEFTVVVDPADLEVIWMPANLLQVVADAYNAWEDPEFGGLHQPLAVLASIVGEPGGPPPVQRGTMFLPSGLDPNVPAAGHTYSLTWPLLTLLGLPAAVPMMAGIPAAWENKRSVAYATLQDGTGVDPNNSATAGPSSVAVGPNASADGTSAVAVGMGAFARDGNVAIGTYTSAYSSGGGSIAILGYAGHKGAVAFGADSYAENQMVYGAFGKTSRQASTTLEVVTAADMATPLQAGSVPYLQVLAGWTNAFDGVIVASDTKDGNDVVKCWKIAGLITNKAGTARNVIPLSVTAVGGDAAAASWTCTAELTVFGLVITITPNDPVNGADIRIGARINSIEVQN